jgi:hypothetical protein
VKPIIFISAVSEEFRGLRRDVADVLRKLGYEPHTQESLPTLEGDLRQALREQIDHCEGLIQIVGAGYGAEPPSVDADYGRVSYTQFEYLYARLKGKKLWVFFAADGDNVGRDKLLAQLDLPKPELAHPDPAAYQAERRALQKGYIKDLRSNGQVRHGFADPQRLLSQVHEIRDELLDLRKQWEVARKRIGRTQLGVGVLVMLAAAGLLTAILTGALARQACQLPGAHGLCRAKGWGGVATAAEEQRFAEAAAQGCPGLRAYLSEPEAHPALRETAQQALAGRVETRTEQWARKDNLTQTVDIRIGTSPLAASEAAARDGALKQAEALAARQCQLATAGEDFRQPPGVAPTVLSDVSITCEPLLDQYHCEVDALAHCQLERRSYFTTETCHVPD